MRNCGASVRGLQFTTAASLQLFLEKEGAPLQANIFFDKARVFCKNNILSTIYKKKRFR
jgi:hypothetical protein